MSGLDETLYHKAIVADHLAAAMRDLLLIDLGQEREGTHKPNRGLVLFSFYCLCLHLTARDESITYAAMMELVGGFRDLVNSNLKLLTELDFLVAHRPKVERVQRPGKKKLVHELVDNSVIGSLRFLAQNDATFNIAQFQQPPRDLSASA